MKKQTIITILVTFVIFTAIAGMAVIKGHNAKIPSNPPGTSGNTAGNLNNKGYFCEHDGKIYFANSMDKYCLYVFDPMTNESQKLLDVPVAYINAAGDYLYFYYDDKGDAKFMGVAGNMRGVYRAKANGKDSLNCLDRTTSGIVSLYEDKLYYQHYDNTEGMTLYSVSTAGKDKLQLSKSIINPSCIIDGFIYYPDTENMFYLNALNTAAGSSEMYVNLRMYNPTQLGEYIIFMNVDDDYRLYRYGLYDHSLAKLTNERIDTFNAYGDSIYYQTNSGSRPRLVRMYYDGSSPQIIAEGNFTDINCTSYYTFFRAFEDENTFYMIPTTGSPNVTTFNPGIDEK